MNKKLIIPLILLLICCLIFGCVPSKQSSKEETTKYIPRFTWNPPTKELAGSTDITFAVVSPSYATREQWMTMTLFKDFSKYLGRNFEELLVAKGFTIKCPFESLESMTYPDKKGSDLAIYPSLELTLDISRIQTMSQNHINILGPDYATFYQEGDVLIGGRVNLVAIEPLSGEKMWIKNIVLEDKTVHCKSEFATREYPTGLNYDDTGIYNPISHAFETYYQKILQTSWEYINTEEMAQVVKKSKEIRDKKVF
jgi:hypothetical protein